MAISNPRSRARSITPVFQDFVRNNIKGTTTAVIANYEVRNDYEDMFDFVTKNYRKLISQGSIVNNPCEYTRESLTQSGPGRQHTLKSDGTVEYTLDGPLTIRYEELSGVDLWVDLPSELSGNGMPRAKQLAIANIDSTPYAFGEDSLELRETLRFLRNPVSSLVDVSRSYRKMYDQLVYKRSKRYKGKVWTPKDFREVTTKAAADAYLQYRFALTPLIRSAMDIIDSYSTGKHIHPTRLTARGFSQDSISDGGIKKEGVWTFDRNISIESEYHASIIYEVTNPIYDWKYRHGFRAKDWPTTVWQIMPYSFMIDRVWDITSFCKGVMNLLDPKVKILTGSERVKHTRTYTYACTDRDSDATWTRTVTGDTMTQKYFEYQRIPWTPSVSDTVPSTSLKTLTDSATKIADLTALIHSAFRRSATNLR